MKPFVIGRKNRLFANTKKGGDVSCAMYSLAKTAIHTGLDVWAYMKWLLSGFPISRRMASFIRTIFRGRASPWTGLEKKREAGRNKEKSTWDTDIIHLRRRYCYTSLFFTLTEKTNQKGAIRIDTIF